MSSLKYMLIAPLSDADSVTFSVLDHLLVSTDIYY